MVFSAEGADDFLFNFFADSVRVDDLDICYLFAGFSFMSDFSDEWHGITIIELCPGNVKKFTTDNVTLQEGVVR